MRPDEGSIVAPDDPFAGLATSIVQRGIPAVIAMQFAITDAAAIVFAEGFYEALAAGYPVDAALGAARMAILTDENDVEWATPVLFMRVPDGRIFDIEGDGREKAGLELELSPEPAVCSPGETVSWRLVARNPGGSELAEVTVHDGPGRRVAGPFVLAGHETRELSWSEPVERDLDQTVTVGGRGPDDSVVSAQATARVSVLEPARLELELRAVPPECVPGEAVSWRTLASIPRRRSSRGPSETPKTTRRITSSVTACIREWTGNSRSSGQESISALTISSTTAS